MNSNTSKIVAAIIRIIILVLIWRAQWSTKIKVIYTAIYIVIGGLIYWKLLYPKNGSNYSNTNTAGTVTAGRG